MKKKARAIVGDPSVSLADESTAALDFENGLAIMTVLADIAKDPARAVFAVTRDRRILPFANRVVRIEDGRIVGEERGGAEQEAREAKTVAGSIDYAET
jgi:putative ABC transport system ATP-binding protein